MSALPSFPPSSSSPASPPAALRVQVRRAACVVRCLARLREQLDPHDAGAAWAAARARAVRDLVVDAIDRWQRGLLDAEDAGTRIRTCVEELEESALAYARSLERRDDAAAA